MIILQPCALFRCEIFQFSISETEIRKKSLYNTEYFIEDFDNELYILHFRLFDISFHCNVINYSLLVKMTNVQILVISGQTHEINNVLFVVIVKMFCVLLSLLIICLQGIFENICLNDMFFFLI